MNENKQKEAVENLEYCGCGTMVSRVGVSLTRGTQFESSHRHFTQVLTDEIKE